MQRRAVLLLALLGLLGLAGAACRKPAQSPSRAANQQGSLPAGCAVVATVDRAALGLFGEMAGSLISSSGVSGAALAGVDLRRDIHRMTYCKLSGAAVRASRDRSVVLFSGVLPSDLVERAAHAPSPPVVDEMVDGVRIVGRDRSWIARRGSDQTAGELVLASDREALRAALFGVAATYETDAKAPVSIVMAASEVQRLMHAKASASPSPIAAVKELRINLVSGAKGIEARFVVGDATLAETFAQALKPALTTVVAQAVAQVGGASPASPSLDLRVEDGDVVARIAVPPEAIQVLASRMATARTARAGARSDP